MSGIVVGSVDSPGPDNGWSGRGIPMQITIKLFAHLQIGRFAEEKREVYSWVKGLWFEGAAATLRELSGLVGWVSRKRNVDLEARWARQATVLNQIGLFGDEPAKGGKTGPWRTIGP